ncbi:MAG: hypothetical protein ACO3JL_15695 [Myxococcota bacterium]
MNRVSESKWLEAGGAPRRQLPRLTDFDPGLFVRLIRLPGLAMVICTLSACESSPKDADESTPAVTSPVESEAIDATGMDPSGDDGLSVFDVAAREEIQLGNASSEADKLERDLLNELRELGLEPKEDAAAGIVVPSR